ncbi:thiamine pyrophosphate-dependent enzyme, partial [Conexibacter sp. JD483]|uniref:thiamine pyrophosphate-dependent enzyme n=3 Tax=unclassified Conexibacter TaxID=2627773 RepID=UPI00286FF846
GPRAAASRTGAAAAPRTGAAPRDDAAPRSRDPEPEPGAVPLTRIAGLIADARRPVLYAGGGVVNADATAELRALAERARIPVVTTLMAKGALPESHPLWAGTPGMHGHKHANLTLNEADLVIAAGARFDDRVTGRLDAFAPGAAIVHLDADPREISKIRRADVAIVGSLRATLAAIAGAVAAPAGADAAPAGAIAAPTGADAADRGSAVADAGAAAADAGANAWLTQVDVWKRRHPLHYEQAPRELAPKPQRVLELLSDTLHARHEDVIWTTGVGQHQMWAMQYLACERTRSFCTSGGHGTMGFGTPAAVGAKAARPGAAVVCVDGDGSFQMTAQELATAVVAELPVLIVILNNQVLGMVDQWQQQFYESRRSHVDLSRPTDCAAVARGFGAAAWTVRSEAELLPALDAALACGRAAVLDVHVALGEILYPMIEPGSAAVEMVEHPALVAARSAGDAAASARDAGEDAVR